MLHKEFSAVVDNTCARVKNILKKKTKEYSSGDPLSHFHQASALLKCTPEQALKGLLTKHIISIYDMIEALPGKDETEEQWDNKLLDIIAYMILLRALNDDRINGDNKLAGTTLYKTPPKRILCRPLADVWQLYGLTLKERLNKGVKKCETL